jgi:nucleoside-diphosphate-sugar epimerase
MRVFVTGASGWIGSAIVPELHAAGHEVVGLARSDASAGALERAGVEVVRGGLDDLDTLAAAAAASDGVIHLAFNHDVAFSGDFDAAANSDRRAVEAMADALAGSDRPFVLASGLLGLTPGKVATEQDHPDPTAAGTPSGPSIRLGTAELTLGLADRGVRSSIVRLPPTCHGDGDQGFMAALVSMARNTGRSGYLGDGTNRWPAVHRLDAARAFALALDEAPAGSTLHAVADEGVPLREVAAAIGRHLDVPVGPVAPERAVEHFGFLSALVALDSPATSTTTRALLGWQPTHPTLIEDLEQEHYFRTAAGAAPDARPAG